MDLTHWRGQRINKISGMSLVTGLSGTGDGKDYGTTINMLAMLQKSWGVAPFSRKDLTAKNVAVVMVEVTIPDTGVSSGQQVDVHITSFGNAKSLAGGRLLHTPLMPMPGVSEDLLLAYASGKVEIPNAEFANRAVVRRGAVFEKALMPQIVDERGVAVLLINRPGGFPRAQAIATAINESNGTDGIPRLLASVPDPRTVQIAVPPEELADPAAFLASVEELELILPPLRKSIVINRRTGTYVASPDIEIQPGARVQRGDIRVQVGPPTQPAAAGATGNAGAADDTGGVPSQTAKLSDLLDALDALAVPVKDVIEIIEALGDRLTAQIRYEE